VAIKGEAEHPTRDIDTQLDTPEAQKNTLTLIPSKLRRTYSLSRIKLAHPYYKNF